MTKNQKILVVDDDDTIRGMVLEILKNSSYHVLEAINGVTGLRLYAEENPDLIILDLMMPRMDGYMFLERLKQITSMQTPPLEFPKIIVLTALGSDQDLGLARNLGALDYIQKPFKSSELIRRIKLLLP